MYTASLFACPLFSSSHFFLCISQVVPCKKGGKWFWCKQNTSCKSCKAQHIINYMFLMLTDVFLPFSAANLFFVISPNWLDPGLISNKFCLAPSVSQGYFFLNTYITLNKGWEASSTYNFHLLICYNLTIKPKQDKLWENGWELIPKSNQCLA